MPDLKWREAIIRVLRENAEPVHYSDIAEKIIASGLKTKVGATPAASVNSTITSSMEKNGDQSPFVRVGPSYYALRSGAHAKDSHPQSSGKEQAPKEIDGAGLINALGMYWKRSNIIWTSTPSILGQQQVGSTPVDFYNQRGVYLLHDGRSVVYVGRTTDQPLGLRLRQHTFDRLNGRWDRFSWFGIHAVTSEGKLLPNEEAGYSQDMLIVTMEALLIEGLEPPQNRKRGDDFRAVEFIQIEDPSIQKNQLLNLMDELKSKIL